MEHMPRYAAVIDPARTQDAAKLAGASVALYLPNTTVPIPGPIGPATLSNPFTTSTGAIEFWLAAPQQVDVQVTPFGWTAAETISGVRCAATTPVPSTLTAFGGQVTIWFPN
jgi:hypothetical protein